MQIPHCSPAVWPEAMPPSRFAAHIHQALPVGARVVLLGLPDDTGVRLNSGRPGAADGPRAFRAALARYGVAHPLGHVWPVVVDAGDVRPAEGHSEAALHETHRRITEATRALLDMQLFPIAVGGGHDLTFPFVRAVAERATREGSGLGGVYFDAHLDVREAAGSGMAFRSLIDRCGVAPLVIAGYGGLVNAREHAEWFASHGGTIAPEDWVSELDSALRDPQAGSPGMDSGPHFLAPLDGCEQLFCSFDLDVIDSSQAPGVSAMNPSGISVRDAARAVFLIASDPRLRCMDFMELSPPHDEPAGAPLGQGRTARVAAHLFLHALMGLQLGPLMAREGVEDAARMA
jgi:formiminoglutamase